MKKEVSIFWFRRDLRLEDNVGLTEALKGDSPVLPIFIFDPEILENLPKDDARVTFIFESLQKLRKDLEYHNSSIAVYHGRPEKVFQELLEKYRVKKVFTNRDYEPYARERDGEIRQILAVKNIELSLYKDQVIFEKNEIVKQNGSPYVVYTHYMKMWKETFQKQENKNIDLIPDLNNLVKISNLPNLKHGDLGFRKSKIKVADYDISSSLLMSYEAHRNFPAMDATSRLGPHLRFGTVSIRNLVRNASEEKNEIFLQELIWREFFMQILFHYPHTVTGAFKPKYDRIPWRNNEKEFEVWKEGKTGYPLVDAGIRQLNSTGFMHNRVRMITASFLCKHLLIDWRWGEAYFAEKLLDYEMASNVGNWQWAAGSGVDAAPYFRIFNPTIQINKFDKERKYINEWVKEIDTNDYPEEMVDHREARQRALSTYKNALNG